MIKAAGILFMFNGKFLLLRRDDGYWGLPGGHLELGETAEQAAIRETLEECQYRVVHPIKEYAENVSPRGVAFTTFLCRVPDEFRPILNHEHTAYLWTSEAPRLTHPALIKILQGLPMEKTYTSEFLKRFDVAKMKRLGYLVVSEAKSPEGTYTVTYRKRTGDVKDSDYEAGYEKGFKGYRAKVWKNGRVVWISSASWLTPEEATEAAKGGIQAHSQGRVIGFSKGTADAVEGIVYKTLAEAKAAAERTGGKVEQKFDTSKEPPYNTYWVVKPVVKDSGFGPSLEYTKQMDILRSSRLTPQERLDAERKAEAAKKDWLSSAHKGDKLIYQGKVVAVRDGVKKRPLVGLKGTRFG